MGALFLGAEEKFTCSWSGSSLTIGSGLTVAWIPPMGSVSAFTRGGSSSCDSDLGGFRGLGFLGRGTADLGLRGAGGIPSICCLKREKRIRAAWPLVMSSWLATLFQSIYGMN